MPPQDNAQDIPTIVYRLNALEIQIQHFEAKVQQWQDEFKSYVSIRENDLRTQAMKTNGERIEGEIADAREEMSSNKKELLVLKDALNAIKTAQDKAQIRVLLAIVSSIVTIASGVLLAVLTHIIQP